MRRLFILILMLLLPLHGWSVEHMRTQMAASQTTAVVSVTGAGHTAMSPDCPLMAGAQASDNDSAGADAQSQRSCQSCQLCMPLMAIESLALDAFAPVPQTPQVPRFSHFASAELERDVKPPIT